MVHIESLPSPAREMVRDFASKDRSVLNNYESLDRFMEKIASLVLEKVDSPMRYDWDAAREELPGMDTFGYTIEGMRIVNKIFDSVHKFFPELKKAKYLPPGKTTSDLSPPAWDKMNTFVVKSLLYGFPVIDIAEKVGYTIRGVVDGRRILEDAWQYA